MNSHPSSAHDPEHAPGGAPEGPGIDFHRVRQDPRFQNLRGRHRRFVFPMTLVFFAWYLAYALTAMYAPDVMARPVIGAVNIGIVWGILQFASTFGITAWYVLFANKVLDPEAVSLREDMERGRFGYTDDAVATGGAR